MRPYGPSTGHMTIHRSHDHPQVMHVTLCASHVPIRYAGHVIRHDSLLHVSMESMSFKTVPMGWHASHVISQADHVTLMQVM